MRFWSKVAKSHPDECWLWTAGVNSHGYGHFTLDACRGKKIKVHRFSWQLHSGTELPDELDVLHRCDNPPCCNPTHLFVGTAVDNVRDMIAKGRAPQRKLTALDRRVIYRLVGRLPKTVLGRIFGVSRRTVYTISRSVPTEGVTSTTCSLGDVQRVRTH